MLSPSVRMVCIPEDEGRVDIVELGNELAHCRSGCEGALDGAELHAFDRVSGIAQLRVAVQLDLNSAVGLFFNFLFRLFLWNSEFQNTMFKLSLDIFLFDTLTNIETSLAGTGITFTTDIFTCLFICFIFI